MRKGTILLGFSAVVASVAVVIKYSESKTSRNIGDFVISKKGVLKHYKGKDITVCIPESVIKVGRKALSGCTSIRNVMIPNSVSKIGTAAFSGCTALNSIEIPSSVNKIGTAAFAGCIALNSVEIPSSVSKIGTAAFAGCISLEKVSVKKGSEGMEHEMTTEEELVVSEDS